MSEPVDTSAEAVERHYGLRDLRALGERFADHMYAMTAERLESKGDIAAELAWRDWQIDCRQDAMDRLQSALTAAHQRLSEQETLLAERNRDAERYRYLRGVDADGTPVEFRRGSMYAENVNEQLDAAVDRAIDAAMGAKE